MKNNKVSKILLAISLFIPSISFAALTTLKTLLTDFKGLMNAVISAIFALSIAFFFWGTAQFILNDAGNDKTREDGKKKMVWGIIALFVMFSIWGILRAIGKVTEIYP
jgi:Na+/H+ antiporter NhaC